MSVSLYEVRAETFEGNTFTLRGGFLTFEAAEDHPVKLSLWKRVWVRMAPLDTTPPPPIHPPPLPWSDEWAGKFTYVRDAENRRVFSVHGVEKRRIETINMLRDAGLVTRAWGKDE